MRPRGRSRNGRRLKGRGVRRLCDLCLSGVFAVVAVVAVVGGRGWLFGRGLGARGGRVLVGFAGRGWMGWEGCRVGR